MVQVPDVRHHTLALAPRIDEFFALIFTAAEVLKGPTFRKGGVCFAPVFQRLFVVGHSYPQ